MSDRAYTLFSVKSIDEEERIIEGIASTPSPDRQGDVMDPLGAEYVLPMPFFWHHNKTEPIGEVFDVHASPEGLAIKARVSRSEAPGRVRDRLEEAWQSFKARPPLVRGLSIDWAPKASERIPGTVYTRHKKWLWAGLSAVTIPANVEASILRVKEFTSPGVAGFSLKVEQPMAQPTAGEHVQALENKRAAITSRMMEIMQGAANKGETLDGDAATEHDGLSVQVKSIDGDLQRWREMEKLQIASAAPVAPMQKAMSIVRAPVPFGTVSVKPNVPIGSSLVRAACALMLHNGNKHEAAEYAKRWDDSTPDVALWLKAAIAPGTSTDAAWAGPLVNQNIANDFIALLRPATILGKIPNFRMTPFNTKVPSQTGGGTYGWVGEAKPKPLTKLAFSAVSLGWAKAAGIIVLTEELIRLSSPSAEDLCRQDMVAGIAQFLDAQFIDPAVAAVAGVNPASITNGAPTAAATTNPLADFLSLINHFATNNIDVRGLAVIMSPANALSLAFRSNLDGSPQFPGVTVEGGTYRGINIVTSTAAGTNVIALQPQLILYADDGGVSIDASREASLQMDSAPVSPADATTVYVSLWQTNTVGLRAERYVNWIRANANAVKYLTATAWPAPTSAAAAAVE